MFWVSFSTKPNHIKVCGGTPQNLRNAATFTAVHIVQVGLFVNRYWVTKSHTNIVCLLKVFSLCHISWGRTQIMTKKKINSWCFSLQIVNENKFWFIWTKVKWKVIRLSVLFALKLDKLKGTLLVIMVFARNRYFQDYSREKSDRSDLK